MVFVDKVQYMYYIVSKEKTMEDRFLEQAKTDAERVSTEIEDTLRENSVHMSNKAFDDMKNKIVDFIYADRKALRQSTIDEMKNKLFEIEAGR